MGYKTNGGGLKLNTSYLGDKNKSMSNDLLETKV